MIFSSPSFNEVMPSVTDPRKGKGKAKKVFFEHTIITTSFQSTYLSFIDGCQQKNKFAQIPWKFCKEWLCKSFSESYHLLFLPQKRLTKMSKKGASSVLVMRGQDTHLLLQNEVTRWILREETCFSSKVTQNKTKTVF